MINSEPSDEFQNLSKLKAFADDKMDEPEKTKTEICFGMGIENIVGKGENAGNQHFLLFPHNVFYGLLSHGR